jgi:hypothetical protein
MLSLFDFTYLVLPAAIALLAGWYAHHRGRPEPFGVSRFLFWYVLIGVGAAGVLDGLSQVFYGQATARLTDWPYSPFLIELGFMNFSFGVIGLVSCWIAGGWRQAAAVGYALFLALASAYHVYDAVVNHNLSAGNVGLVLVADIGVSCLLFILTFLEMRGP